MEPSMSQAGRNPGTYRSESPGTEVLLQKPARTGMALTVIRAAALGRRRGDFRSLGAGLGCEYHLSHLPGGRVWERGSLDLGLRPRPHLNPDSGPLQFWALHPAQRLAYSRRSQEASVYPERSVSNSKVRRNTGNWSKRYDKHSHHHHPA